MTSRKRNEWLDAGESDEEDAGYDSEAVESRGAALGGRAAKRRKVESGEEVESGVESAADEDEEEEEAEEKSEVDAVKSKAILDSRFDTTGFDDEEDGLPPDDDEDTDYLQDDLSDSQPSKPTNLKPLTPAQLAKAQKRAQKTGVIYLSRIPPFMKPSTLRSLLTPYGAINRIFLTPEPATAHRTRVRTGGNRKKSYTDGWVEFVHKRDAKYVAEMLNTQTIGGKKGGYYYDDVWNIKYLRGFKWSHLTEQIAAENAERAARLRAEIARTTRENWLFLQNVERAKMLEGMEAKRKGKEKRDGGGGTEGVPAVVAVEAKPGKQDVRRHFRQNEVKVKKPRGKAEQSEEVKRVLSKIF